MKYAVILLRYIKGYVRIRAEGGFPERFLNLCYSGKINLWDVCLQNKVMTFCISRSDFLKLRSLSHKAGVRVSIINKTGLIYKYRKYHKRTGIITGVILFLTVHLFLSMFVWCVDVSGNDNLSKSELFHRAEQYGLSAGTLKKSFDEIRTARSIAADYDGKVTWLSVNIKGSLAVIELREDNRIITETENRPPCNIVADFDGVILSAETFYGDCTVKSGTGVKKGDLLINGAIQNEDLSTTFYAAKGKLTAVHEKELSITKKIKTTQQKLTVGKKKYKIGFFGLEIPSEISADSPEEIHLYERSTLNINGYNLPFYIEKHLICEKMNTETKKSSATTKALEEIQNSVYKENSNSTIISAKEKISSSDNTLNFSGKYTLIDFIGEEKPILSEKQK